MREVLPGVYEWSSFSTEKRIDFNGHLIVTATERVVVDPPTLTSAERAVVDRVGPVTAVVVTNRDHVREADAWRAMWSAPLWAPAPDAADLGLTVDRRYGDGDRLPGGLTAIAVPHGKSPGESALWLPALRAMIVGDAVIGRPAGSLAMLPDEKFSDPRKALEGVKVLLDHHDEIDAVLVGDGVSVLVGGRAALERLTAVSV